MDKAFKRKACIAPDILVRLVVYSLCQLSKAGSLIHRVAARERDVGKRVGHDDTHQLGRRHLMPAIEVPRLRIMASRALVTTASTIDGGPESRTIHHRIFYDG